MNMNSRPLWRRLLPAAVLVAAVLCAFLFFTGVVGTKADAESLALAEESVRRAAVECYALEGFYPTDAAYLAEHYGVTLESSRYLIRYEYIASNLMPSITVLPRS